MTEQHDNRPAFTLVELILVMTILSIIGIIAVLAIANIKEAAMMKDSRATMDLIANALDQYKEDCGHYPRTTGDMLAGYLTNKTMGWKRASMKDWFPKRQSVKDAWGMDFYYCNYRDYEGTGGTGHGVERTPKKRDFYNPKTYQLYSLGPNMKTWPETGKDQNNDNYSPRLCGTEPDDIRNWEHETFYTPAAYK